ncbi:MAG TPA: hypothetical protein VKE91_07805, partial [Blastocatellia bacterium]|nr:hypothetical protein [Blastocatellia bacterium]
LGFLDGRAGLIFCTLMSMHEAVIAAKIYEQRLDGRKYGIVGDVVRHLVTDGDNQTEKCQTEKCQTEK